MRARAWIAFAAAVGLQVSAARAEVTPDLQAFPCPGPSETLWLATSAAERPEARAELPGSGIPQPLARIERRNANPGGAFPTFAAGAPAQRPSRPSNDPRSPTYLPGFNR